MNYLISVEIIRPFFLPTFFSMRMQSSSRQLYQGRYPVLSPVLKERPAQ